MAGRGTDCTFCRMMRGMAFSAIGGGAAGYTALSLGMQRSDAIIAAFFGAMLLVLLVNRKRKE